MEIVLDGAAPQSRDGVEGFALAVQVQLKASRSESDLQISLAGDLLDALFASNAPAQADPLLDRAHTLGHQLRGPHRLALLTSRVATPPGILAGIAQQLAAQPRQVTAATGRPLIGILNGAVVALLPQLANVNADANTIEQLRSTMQQLLGDIAVHALIKNNLLDLTDYRPAHRLLTKAVGLLTRHSPATIDIDAFGLYSVLLDAGPGETLSRFATDLLSPLLDNSPTSSQLLLTLHAWYAADMNTTNCARQLYLHRNTVSYRLRKVEELLNVNLTRFDDTLRLQLALIVNNITGSPARREQPNGDNPNA